MEGLLFAPKPKEDVFVKNANSIKDQINAEGHEIFLFDHFEYPEEGGILAYKYGGILIQPKGEIHRYFCKPEELEEIEKKEAELGYRAKVKKVQLCHNCNLVEVHFVPALKVENRVDLLYPEKGFQDMAFLDTINIVKANLIAQMRFLASKEFMVFALLPFKNKIKLINKWIQGFNRSSEKVLTDFYIKEQYFCNLCRELIIFIDRFLTELGVSGTKEFAINVAMLIEFDSAHRMRLEDLFSVTSKELILKNPRLEVKKIVQALEERDERINLKDNYKSIANLVSLILLHPKIKKEFKKAIDNSKFENFQLDEADDYHSLIMGSYKFRGRHWKERVEEYKKLHNQNWPIACPITVE